MAISCPLSPTPHLYHTHSLSLSLFHSNTHSHLFHTQKKHTHWLTKAMTNIPKLIKGNNLLMFLYLTRCRFNVFLLIVIQEDSFFLVKLVTLGSKISQFMGKRSLDRISLDIFSWSKVSNNLGIWPNSFLAFDRKF